MSMSITELNKKHPVKLMIHLVDDDAWMRELVKEVLKLHGMPNVLDLDEWGDPDEYSKFINSNPDVLPNICVFDYIFKDAQGRTMPLDGLDLTRTIMKRAEDKDENAKPKVIMVSAYRDPKAIEDFINSDGFRWVYKNFDPQVLKKDLIDAVNVAVIRTKKALENLAFFDKVLQMEYLNLNPGKHNEPL